MAVPRKRKSHRRRREQRSHDALTVPTTNACSNCGEPRQPHRVCGSCGWYKDRVVVETSAE
ncbi:MAG: 50S ribosomal protein L32 [Deltaproteobacteria bacterium]|nr:50S ribosomal protein L32 [Deltaproteobacteria bacterium]